MTETVPTQAGIDECKLSFSVIIPAYNAQRTLGAAIESVLRQPTGSWQVIVVDDGSTDDTAAVARAYAESDQRVSVISKQNGGSASAVNRGIDEAHGDFIIRLDADDELLSSYSSVVSQFIAEHPGFDIYASNAYKVYPNGRRALYHKAPRFREVFSLSVEDMIQACQVYGTAAVRRGLFDEMGRFDEERVTAEDYDFWIRALANGACHIYIPEALALYHMTPGQKTENVVRSRSMDIDILESLIASGALTTSQIELARTKIASLHHNVAFRKRITALIGPRLARPVFAAAHKAAWLVRPHRRA